MKIDMEANVNEEAKSLVEESDVSPSRRKMRAIYSSSKCQYLYFILLLVTISLNIWSNIELFNACLPNRAFYVFESVVNLILLVDISIRLWVAGCYKFFTNVSNFFELLLAVLCIILCVATHARCFAVHK
eukprot:TRINITY_DN10544_c0_g6_i1.p2 TRINITY_DN10544_c0_g6~~TRINITY_DN10544_c0_g6_i1.p2  ORF type:complete len:130 (-),score=18.34 TRINITY_DN10544_c0_g6_i1:290-679(-)